MTEAIAARSYDSPGGASPRVTAASFRNLTARLKKVDAAPISEIVPVQPAAPPASPVEVVDIMPPLAQPAPAAPENTARPKTPRRILKAQGTDPFAQALSRFEMPDFIPLESAGAGEQQVSADADQEHGAPWPEASSPGRQAEESAPSPGSETAPSSPSDHDAGAALAEAQPGAVAEPETAPEEEQAPVEQPAAALAGTPEPVLAAQVEAEIALPAADAPVAAAEFAAASADEHAGAAAIAAEAAADVPAHKEAAHLPHVPPTQADSAVDAARKEHLSRKEALELEYVWRSLLATPTIEERAQFVREVADALASLSQELPAPAPEHDLSRIAPAAEAELLEQGDGADAMPAASAEPKSLVTEFSADLDPLADNVEIARSLLDMMAAGSTSGLPHERALAADTLLRLVPRLESKPLIMMAQRLAKADNPPALLVAKLIRDPRVEVAGPLLEDCPQITDKDLDTVVAEGNSAKLRMLARRRHLTVAISDSLIRTRDPSVLLTLVRNADAAISQEGFLALIGAAEQEKELLAPLCTRPDLPAPLAFELFWSAPPQLRRFILSRFLTDSETLTKILKITLSTNSPEEPADEVLNQQHLLVEALERAARGKLEIAADELGQALQIAPATATRILNDAEGEPLMVLLKVAGYPRQALAGLMRRFRDADLPMLSSGRELDELQSIFDTLSFNKARILLTYWDWAQRKTGPYAPLH